MDKAERSEGKRLEIVKRAFDQFYDGGFHATGVDTILAETGISKRTLYKYFPSKDDLIEAVLDYYGAWIVGELFDPVASLSATPREQILAFFDVRRARMQKVPNRGCLGIKASQEFVGKHAGIMAHGKQVTLRVESVFVELCERAGFTRPAELGKQLNLLFQGAMLLSLVYGDSSPFGSAKDAVVALLDAQRDGASLEA
ncbi:TetR/AcrR family transcriptional regulator [Methylobacterium sp. C25]|uniref:TetR/AcrR family transcriptional regulator n=1 Tax=Methylobacterium sp. C25 TaxID=2721622 RepID=UPI001F385805|nr:TetR/AcrR family transcriptional regulator [Methylobacterium sp. C25]MCE4226164.1 TetR/AcrR family transcriptional regulator [Methylobacterium sp. C25]